MSVTRILLIDDHPLLLKGLAQLINEEDGLEVPVRPVMVVMAWRWRWNWTRI